VQELTLDIRSSSALSGTLYTTVLSGYLRFLLLVSQVVKSPAVYLLFSCVNICGGL